MKKIIYPMAFVAIFAASCGGNPGGSGKVISKTVNLIGESEIYNYSFGRPYLYSANYKTKVSPDDFTWSISDPEAADLSKFGRAMYLTPKKVGLIQLKVTLNGDSSVFGTKTINIKDPSDQFDDLTKEEYAQEYEVRYDSHPSYDYTVSMEKTDKVYNLNTGDEYNFVGDPSYDGSGVGNPYGAHYKVEMKYKVDEEVKSFTFYGATNSDHVSSYFRELESYGIDLEFKKEKTNDNPLLIVEGKQGGELVYLHACDERCLTTTLADYIENPDAPESKRDLYAICHFDYQ